MKDPGSTRCEARAEEDWGETWREPAQQAKRAVARLNMFFCAPLLAR
jgi:hypothetical protein